MTNPCLVKGCGFAASTGVVLKAPLDDGTEHILQLPIHVCANHRENVDVKGSMTDEVWTAIEKALPPERKTEREKVTVELIDIRKFHTPPEIENVLLNFSRAFALCDQQRTIQTRAQAIKMLASRAAVCARVLRNYPGAGQSERAALAKAFQEIENASEALAKHLFRTATDSEELTTALREAGGHCIKLISPMLLAVDLNIEN